MPRQAFWTAPARSWLARNGPRSALGRHLGVQKPSRARLDAFLKRPWAPKTTQDRFFVDLGGRFGLDFRRFSNDFLSIFARAACDEDTKKNLKKESRGPRRKSWLLRWAVASYCSHVFRNYFRTLRVQLFLLRTSKDPLFQCEPGNGYISHTRPLPSVTSPPVHH